MKQDPCTCMWKLVVEIKFKTFVNFRNDESKCQIVTNGDSFYLILALLYLKCIATINKVVYKC